ncbi:hypothetical protein AB0F20_20550 [Streptomyces goshikiensis]|uniref:hypothetical protein n=1 Tax=Streptomyces goshikiensis TaxID=1942 RepID=UPI0033C4C826
MERIYVGERAVSLATGTARWVVVDARSYGQQTEAVAYLASLRARDCSPNTERAYAGRIALYLNFCLMRRLEWKTPSFLGLAALQQYQLGGCGPARLAKLAEEREATLRASLPMGRLVLVQDTLEKPAARAWVNVASIFAHVSWLVPGVDRGPRFAGAPGRPGGNGTRRSASGIAEEVGEGSDSAEAIGAVSAISVAKSATISAIFRISHSLPAMASR